MKYVSCSDGWRLVIDNNLCPLEHIAYIANVPIKLLIDCVLNCNGEVYTLYDVHGHRFKTEEDVSDCLTSICTLTKLI
jgi:hypothetical protein